MYLEDKLPPDLTDGSGGGGKSGGAGAGGKEAPNTLRSKAIARFVQLLGEGEIKGLVAGAQSIFLNKVPYANPDGSENFKGLTWELKPGTPDQTHLPGFPNVTSEFEVNLRVKNATPVTYRTQASALSAIVATLNIPALTSLDKKKGELRGYSVTVALDIKSLANPLNPWVTKVASDYISGKNTSPYERSYRVDLEGPGPWLVRMRRLSPDSDDDSTITDDTYFSHITEITDHKIAYSDSAVIGIEIDTEQLGNSADIRFDIDGKLIRYPSNYNPVTRTYTGFWNGTWSIGFCDNPAWVFMDVCQNPRYGIGLPDALIDKWGLYQLAQYCDALVPDGEGGQQPRFTFNGTFYQQAEAYKVLQTIASMMRAIVFYSAGSVIIRHDAPMAPQQRLYTPANTIGDFNYSSTAKSVRHTACITRWTNPALGYENDYAVYEDRDAILKYGYNKLELEAIGTTNRGQAYRQAKWAVLTEQLQTDTVTFGAGADSQDVLPGDIVELADPHWATADFGGRVEPDPAADGITKIKLDRSIEFAGATAPALHLTLLDGPIDDVANVDNTGRPIKREIRYFSSNILAYDAVTKIVTLETAIPAGGNDNVTPLVWIFSKAQIAPRPFKVIGIEEDADDGNYTITALEYSTQKFVRIDENFKIDYRTGGSFSNLPTTAYCEPPSRLRAEPSTKIVNGIPQRTITISWDSSPDKFLQGYVVTWKRDDDSPVIMPLTMDNTVDIDGPTGNYHITVRAANKFGVYSSEIKNGLSVTEQSAGGQAAISSIVTDRGNTIFTDKDIRLFWLSNALSQGVKTPAIKARVLKPGMTVTESGGEVNVTGGVGTTSTAAAAVSITNPDAPTITFSGSFDVGDGVEVRVGFSTFTYRTSVSATPAAIASAVAAQIDLDPRYTASAALGVVTLGFVGTATNASNLSSHDDPLFRRYRIRVLNPDTNAVVRTDYTLLPEYVYPFANNQLDFITARRTVRFEVSVEDINGALSQISVVNVSNPVPTPPPIIAEASLGVFTIRYTPPTDPDFAGMVLYMSSTSGFIPGDANRVFKDRGNPAIPVASGQVLYYKYGFFDSFGDTGIALSTEQSVTTAQITQSDLVDLAPPEVVTGLTLTSSVVTTDGAPWVKLTAKWNASLAVDLGGYTLAIKEGAGAYTEFEAGELITEFFWPVVAGLTYTAKIRAFDKYNNRGPYSPEVSHIAAKDNVPPAVPTGLAATASFQNIFLTWVNPADLDVAHIEVWENTIDDTLTATRLVVVNAEPNKPGGFVRGGLTTNTTRFFWLKAVDTSGNVSPFSMGISKTTAFVPTVDLSGTINELQIANDAVTAAKIAVGAINDTAKFAQSIRPPEIMTALPTVGNYEGRLIFTGGKLYRYVGTGFTANVASSDISGQVSAAQIAGIEAAKITGQIVATQITDGAISTPKLAAGSVTTAKLTAGAVTAAEIAAGAIVAGKIAAGVVTAAEIAADTITAGNIAAGAIGASEIAVGAVIAGKIAADAIVAANIQAGQIVTDKLAADAVTTAKLAARAVTALKIAAGTITANEIAAGAIVANNIAAGAIVADKIAGGSITGEKFNTATSLPGTITVGFTGVQIGTIEARAADPAARVNAHNTLIEPGRLKISGSTTFEYWKNGPNSTDINGAVIGTNTVSANKVLIGLRGINITGIEFSSNAGNNTINWSNGSVEYINDGGGHAFVGVSGGSASWPGVNTTFVYWTKGAVSLSATTNPDVAATGDNIVLATYRGGHDMVVTYGRTIVDGSKITADSVDANRIRAGSVIAGNILVGSATGPTITRLGETATWSAVQGTGRPQDNATVGATWGSNIASQPTSLSGINGTEGNKLAGIEQGATRGLATRQDNPGGVDSPQWYFNQGGRVHSERKWGGDIGAHGGWGTLVSYVTSSDTTQPIRQEFYAADGRMVYRYNSGTLAWAGWVDLSHAVNNSPYTSLQPGKITINGGTLANWIQPGQTTINGGAIHTRTIGADKIAANSITANELTTGLLITNSAQIGDAIINNAKIGNLQVDTIKIASGAVTVPTTVAGADVFVHAGAYQIAMGTDYVEVGDGNDGGAVILAFAEIDSGAQRDVGGRINLYVDQGHGYFLAGSSAAGARTVGGDTYLKAAILASATVAGSSHIRVNMDIQSIAMPNGSPQSFTLRKPQIVIMGAKR